LGIGERFDDLSFGPDRFFFSHADLLQNQRWPVQELAIAANLSRPPGSLLTVDRAREAGWSLSNRQRVGLGSPRAGPAES
jgi:hypothetical protein